MGYFDEASSLEVLFTFQTMSCNIACFFLFWQIRIVYNKLCWNEEHKKHAQINIINKNKIYTKINKKCKY